jgi:transcription termination factor Rho
MTEPAEQPLLKEQTGESKKPAKKRTTKPRTSAAKTTKPRAKKAAKPAAEAALPEAQPDLPVAEVVPPAPAAPAPTAVEEWSPSPAKAEPAPVAPPAPVEQPVVRQRPVYIPRHVAKQMEEQARLAGGEPGPIPIALPAEEAARYIPVQEPPRMEASRAESPRVEAPPREEELGEAEGIVEVSGKGFGFLRDPKRGFAQHPNDVFVTPELCRSYNLRDGQWVKGQTRRGNRGAQLFRITEINGGDPAKAQQLPTFDELTVVSPNKRIRLETVPERFTTRVIDLMCPVGKGQRGLIVAPPRTGKTTLLQHIADAVVKNHPEITLIILLVDERPEEVTEIKRTVPTAELMASSNDSDIKSHTRIAQLAIERAKRLVESGKDVFVLLDSITRVGRAFNNATGGGGRTMSGGIDSRALEIPRKIFAAARNTEEAGSLTIIATALIDTGSRMDELIFQEFKGTGNMELVLNRKISDNRIYPAVDIFQSGTRREELLIPEADLHKINVIRRGLAGHKEIEAIERLLFFVKKFPTNAQMLREIPG